MVEYPVPVKVDVALVKPELGVVDSGVVSATPDYVVVKPDLAYVKHDLEWVRVGPA